MCYYIGILGNSLGTTGVLVAEDGTYQQRARSAAGMEWRDGRYGSAAQTVRQIVEELAELQELSFGALLRDCGRVAIAMPGFDQRITPTRFLAQLNDYQFNPDATRLTSVAEAGFVGAFHAGPGLLIRTGHGSSAFFRTSTGETRILGDSGLLFGDHGSASWLGKKAFQTLTKARNYRGSDVEVAFGESLCRKIFEEKDLSGDELLDLPFRRLEQARSIEGGLGVRKYLTAIGRVTAHLAAGGDVVAQGFVTQGQRHLLEMVREPISRLNGVQEKLVVCIRGSLAEDSPLFREGLLDLLLGELSSCVQPPDGLNGSHSSVVGTGLIAIEPDTVKRSQLTMAQAKFLTSVQPFPWSQPIPRFLRRPPQLSN